MRINVALATITLFVILGCQEGEKVVQKLEDLSSTTDVSGQETSTELPSIAPELISAEVTLDLVDHDFQADTATDIPVLQCDPGEGCFMDKCQENADCQSGWCVEHMGEGVCSKLCQEECPDGWTCRQVGAGGPDITFICVSDHSNLCKPCTTNSDCKAVGGADDACIGYATEGSFCGGTCSGDEECPWGFSCQEAETVEGVVLTQCFADAGTCPCTGKSIALALTTPCAISNEHGLCTGKRACMVDGLSDCDAAVPAQEQCNGLDDDCDDDVDEPAEIDGNYVNLCDDDNPCTDDLCLGEVGCEQDVLTQGECIDGDSCTVGDHCQEGDCVGNPVICDDDNPCTNDSCDGLGGCEFSSNSADCDDGDPCTVADECLDSACQGYQVDCECMVDADCDALEDGDLCNGTLVCDTAQLPHKCSVDPATEVTCPEIAPGPDAICQQMECNPATGECNLVPHHEGFACDDADACTVGDKCDSGTCIPGVPQQCADNNPCTDDSCDPTLGCQYSDNAAPCNDDDVCTTEDVCLDGQCMGGAKLACDDGNVCTGEESCDADIGCIPGQPLDCGDGDLCNGVESCDPANGCQAGVLLSCNDGSPCTDDLCDPVQGCLHSHNSSPCSDGNICTSSDICVDGECVSGESMACNDDNVCTDDNCHPASGCIHSANQAACSDGNKCTQGDVCAGGICTFSEFAQCNDSNPCTDDVCDPGDGCIHTLNDAPCDDSDPCTTGDHCHLGACIGGGSLGCDDGNPCTDDSCDVDAGCQFVPNDAACDDGNNCTTGDVCSKGWCSFTGFESCDDELFCNGEEVCSPAEGCVDGPVPVLEDGNPCTVDSCDEDGDLVLHLPSDSLCDDKLFCTGVETCDPIEGCKAGAQVVVDDQVECTIDQCDEINDIVLHIPVDADCIDGNVCNGLEYCNTVAGCASGAPLNCTDQHSCTADSCDPTNGCTNQPDDNACDDGNGCTTDSCNQDAGCVYMDLPDNSECTINNASGKCTNGTCELDCVAGNKGFNHTGGAQTFELPSCASKVTIEAWGAEGGDEESGKGGKGAYMRGTFNNLAGKTLEIRVGGQGHKGTCNICGGGGGGGSWVWVQGAGNPLLIAGGGGGASYQGDNGFPGLTTQQSGGGGYSPPGIGHGGKTDNGGGGGTGSGGGGWLSNGQGNNWSTGGIQKGGAGGNSDYMGHGGFGSGGAAFHGGGGGGGYSGGSGGTYPTGAGGGGSYNAGSDQSAQSGVRSGHGEIKITWQ